MEKVAFAAIGIEPHDLTALKSTLSMVAGESVTCNQVEQPEQAQVTFVCGLPPAQISLMVQKLGATTMLVYCCGRGETPPEGIFTIRRPLRSTDISELLDELKKRSAGSKS